MAQRSLFSQFGDVFGGAAASGKREIVSFNAGKMHTKPTNNGKVLVTPDMKKGKICLYKGEDQLVHFQWLDRQTGVSQEDVIIFPEEATFSRVNTGREHDRVYLLQYKNSSRRFFYWMQNKDALRDSEVTKRLNDAMNNSVSGQGNNEGGRSGNMQLDQTAIMQMLGAMASGENSRGTPANRSTSRNTGNSSVQMSELQNILQQMGLPAQSATSSPATSAVSASSHGSQSGAASSVAATTASTQDHDVANMEVDEMSEEELLRMAIEESMRETHTAASSDQQGNTQSHDHGPTGEGGDASIQPGDSSTS
ncbi:unnamed protein product [Albugo candida]|uniref:Pru domain-containing protein n=1 Tax=Albugo candida TaxID=65357 RepID=A0A024FTF4_9STRA|nr:unnamed protein product [Albugo candida]|eukprot:CCI10301.1 unnamed protein product [Albugo candida]